MAWKTVPICWDCWKKLFPNKDAVHMKHPIEETCHNCGKVTTSGIYVRADDGERGTDGE